MLRVEPCKIKVLEGFKEDLVMYRRLSQIMPNPSLRT